MNRKWGLAGLFAVLLCGMILQPVQAGNGDCQRLENALGYKLEREKDVCKMELLRKELHVTHKGIKLSPVTMELELLANFERIDNRWMVMGEFALLEQEVNPVIDRLRKSGLEVTAVHNHMLFEEPRIIYVHFQGEGSPEALAKGVRSAVQATSYRRSTAGFSE